MAFNSSSEPKLRYFTVGLSDPEGIIADDIWEYSPQIGYDAGQDEPDWL